LKKFSRKKLGNKRYEILDEHVESILKAYTGFEKSKISRVFSVSDFSYREIIIQRPLRLKFEINNETLDRLKKHKDFINNNRATIYSMLEKMYGEIIKSKAEFLLKLKAEFEKHNLKIEKRILKIIWQEIGVRDEKAEICLDDDGNPEADSELKDFERVPWGHSIQSYFNSEIKPFFPDAWIDEAVCDTKDGKIGVVGYEIPFSRFFNEYKKPRELADVMKDIVRAEKNIANLLEKL
jgi:type I restriction enzyme M protein